MPEITKTYIKYPIVDEKKIKTYYGIFWISRREGIRGIYGKIKNNGNAIVSVWFLRSKGWDMDKAKKWIEKHKDSLLGKK